MKMRNLMFDLLLFILSPVIVILTSLSLQGEEKQHLGLSTIIEYILPSASSYAKPIYDPGTQNMLTEALEKCRQDISGIEYGSGDTIFVIIDRGRFTAWNKCNRVSIRYKYLPGLTRNDFKRELNVSHDTVRIEAIPLNVKILEKWDPKVLEKIYREKDKYIIYEPYEFWQSGVYRCIITDKGMEVEMIPYYTSQPLTEEEYLEYREKFSRESSKI